MKVLQLPTINDENKDEAKAKVAEFLRNSHHVMATDGVSFIGIAEMEDGTIRLMAAKDKEVLEGFLTAMSRNENMKRWEINEARTLQ